MTTQSIAKPPNDTAPSHKSVWKIIVGRLRRTPPTMLYKQIPVDKWWT